MIQKLLLVRLSALGDLVLTTGPLHQLKKHYPNLEVHFLTSDLGHELFRNQPLIDHVHVLPKKASVTEIIRAYRKLQKYDAIIDWQGNLKSFLLRTFQRAPFYRIEKQSRQRRAYVKKRLYKDQLNQHVVEKYYNTLKKAFPELPDLDAESLRPILTPNPTIFKKNQFDWTQTFAIHPFASQKNKEWFGVKELSERLILAGKNVVILGQSEELLDWPQSKQLLDLTNKTTILEMTSLIQSCRALLTTDSGPMHLGIAVNTPTVALFGPTTKEFGFYPRFKNTQVIETDLDCRPCHVHGGQTCPLKHHKCMNEISVDEVFHALQEL
jgi:heptosyltransferase-2